MAMAKHVWRSRFFNCEELAKLAVYPDAVRYRQPAGRREPSRNRKPKLCTGTIPDTLGARG